MIRLLEANEVAFLGTVSQAGRPRVHPFVPKIVHGELVTFIMDDSPKFGDLKSNGFFALHLLPGPEDEEFYVSGTASQDVTVSRETAASAMGFATGVDEHHVLFELRLDQVLWTRWLDFGTPAHRPQRLRWSAR